MVKFGDIIEAVKKLDDTHKFVNLKDLDEFVTRATVSKGKYKVTLEFDAKQMLFNPDSIPIKRSDYRYTPFLLIIEQDWKKIKREEKRND